jgi:peptidoglycan hydrolase-like protein with peptidoglycan-binding domain
MKRLLLAVLVFPLGALASQDPYTGFISEVQERLRALGFDAGPVNGDFGEKTQAALAQFQLSRIIPASGQLDDQTLDELGVQRPLSATAVIDGSAAGASAPEEPSGKTAGNTPAGAVISTERTAEPKGTQ